MFTHLFWRKVGLSFARAFTVTLALGLLPVIDSVAGEGAYDIDAGRKALVALVVASVVAGVRAGQALFTTFETPPSQ